MIHKLTAIKLREAFLKGEITAATIAEHFLNRIKTHNEELGAFLSVLAEKTLLKAEHLDHKRKTNQPLGKLAGVPIAIKDNMHIKGEITSCASQFLRNYKAPFDATAVRHLEDEDALLIGKTNLDEFAMGVSNENSSFFPALNPWDLNRVAGGSSGGSASAVASRLSLLATGSDTGGSIRLPASFCGVVGYKPTYGRVSRYGLVAFGSSLDQIGPFATSVEDIALTMEIIGVHCPNDATSLDLPQESYTKRLDLKGVKFGVPRHFLEGLNEEASKNFEESLIALKNLGAEIIDINLDICKYSVAVYQIIANAEASTNLARFDGIRYGIRSKEAKTLEEVYGHSRDIGFGAEVKRRILLGTFVLSAGFQDAYYKKAQKVRTLIIDAIDSAFNECDAIVTPVAPGSAFEKGSLQDLLDLYLLDLFTIPANLAGLPSISVPSGYDSNNMPLGLLISAPQMCDVLLIDYAYAYEQATKHIRIPEAYAGEKE
jgi:aspartyl-tRNA(Asn)/glutamyl-tRNA(Gln) amidotransferase subunit A